VKVIFVTKSGLEMSVTFSEGQTLFTVAENNHVPLGGACKGNGACGGCHVIVENLHDQLPKASEPEEDTLDRVRGVAAKSRLACQLVLSAALDGLLVRLV
jgi:2Fe-2S ferredoxin